MHMKIVGFQNELTFGMNIGMYLTQFLPFVQLVVMENLMQLTGFENVLQ